jgi:tetratricopeptide (TPR) repeat protein
LPIVASRQTFAAALLVLMGISHAQAQVIRVAGTIRDDDGRPVRGAAIMAENPDHTPPRLTTTSNDKGEFGFIGIRRGVWTMNVEAPGFERLQLRRPVGTGRQQSIEVRLARTATPVALPLDGLKASEIQQRIERAEALAASGDLDGAIVAWRDVLDRVPALSSVHLRLGALYERKPDPERARAAYRQLLVIEPGNATALAAIARLDKQF